MNERVECTGYTEWLENMVVMLSKDFRGLVNASTEDFLIKNAQYLPYSNETRKSIRIIAEEAEFEHKKLSPEEIEHYTKVLIHNKTIN